MIYYIADTHLGHANIIRLNNRPFKSIEEMDRKIIDNWNKIVKPEDDIYIVGDLMYKCPDPGKYLAQLSGKKHLIKGNHDKYIKNKGMQKYFESISLIEDIMDGGRRVILCHYPMVEWDGYFRNSIHIYGHIHNNIENKAYKVMKEIPNAYNAGADILDFTPCTLDDVIRKNKEFQKKH